MRITPETRNIGALKPTKCRPRNTIKAPHRVNFPSNLEKVVGDTILENLLCSMIILPYFLPREYSIKSAMGGGWVDDQEGGHKLNHIMGDKHPAHDKYPILWKRKPQRTENQEAEDADICEVLNNSTGINHAVTRRAALPSGFCPFVEETICHLCPAQATEWNLKVSESGVRG
jgi:hypothetical protein